MILKKIYRSEIMALLIDSILYINSPKAAWLTDN